MAMKMRKCFSEKTFSQKLISKSNHGNENINMAFLKMRRSISDKTLLHKQKMKKKSDNNDQSGKSNRFLIIINIFGSAGPIRFVVNEEDNAAEVIETALELYAREGRLPILGFDINSFFLYPNAGFDALEPLEAIGSAGVRNFVLCKKQRKPHMTEGRSSEVIKGQKGSRWRAWLQKSSSLKFLSH